MGLLIDKDYTAIAHMIIYQELKQYITQSRSSLPSESIRFETGGSFPEVAVKLTFLVSRVSR
jgi:hypothetical protein